MSTFTVLGATGFIGRHLVAYLQREGHTVQTPDRDAENLLGVELGNVIYCIGTTGNFRQYPQAAVEAHVSKLLSLMKGADFESWLYLSSTRIYGGLPEGSEAREDVSLPVLPSADSLYDLSKMLGESFCLSQTGPSIRVARLSNVFGVGQSPSTFLGSVLRDLADKGSVTIGESRLSEKDYISIEDAVFFLSQISLRGKERLYNIAAGYSVSHEDLAEAFRRCGKTVTFAENGSVRRFPKIDISRLSGEFGGPRRGLLQEIPEIISKLST